MITTAKQNPRALTNTPSGEFLLPKDMFVCFRGDQAVILDLGSDRYLAVDARGANALKSLFPGEASGSQQDAHELDGSDAKSILEKMAECRMLTKDPREGKVAIPVCLPTPVRTLIRNWSLEGQSPLGDTKIRVAHLLAFAIAVIAARWSLRVRKLKVVVAKVSGKRVGRATSFDFAKAAALTDVFNLLRPFLLTASDACLLNSLALLNFLRWFEVYPSWVFGVRHVPFAAHCWVQQDGVLLNDHIEHAQLFTPIMVV